MSSLIAVIGLFFVVMKYYLDRANYQKSLFEERYLILTKLDEIIFDFYHGKDWKELKQKLDSIYRRSYFLFGHNTYQFIVKFGKAIIDASMLKDLTDAESIQKVNEAKKFLAELLDGQKLSEKLSEMKIDTY